MVTAEEGPVRLTKGANVGLRDLDAELGSVTVVLETHGAGGHPVDADVSVLLLTADGNVRSGDDLIFYNHPVALGGAVHLRDKIRPDDGEAASIDVMTLELDDVPDEVHRVVVAASLDTTTGQTFGDASSIVMRLQRSADAQDLVEYRIEDASDETALLFGEIYRRDTSWRIRAVGQGYRGGLAALVTDHGVEVTADSGPDGEPDAIPADGVGSDDTVPSAPADTEGSCIGSDSGRPPAGDVDAAADEAEAAAAATTRAVSVRRPTRAPRLPADWDATIPVSDETDWQPARLFPVAGIGASEEQERRATSAFLAVLEVVREFGRSITALCGAPAGAVESYVEVPFGHDEAAVRPDGLIRVRRGTREWVALVEVKTSDNALKVDQVDRYVDIARDKGFDAVVTISNELTGASGDHPLGIDRRKLRKVVLVHLSWDQIRAEAITLVDHGGIADATQHHVLNEFVRYMTHQRSGMHGMVDMGKNWTRVRDGVKVRTVRANDKAIAEISGRFDQLVEHVAHELSGLLGVRVQAQVPRNAPDNASRCQQLADSGLLFGCLRVPGAVNTVVVRADLHADRVASSITIDAPRDGRPLTRINWLLRQLPEHAADSLRIEALLAGGRGASTVQLLGKVRAEPSVLLPDDGRDIRAFTITHELPMGPKRSAASGSLIHSVRAATMTFYADVVQHLRPWAARPRT